MASTITLPDSRTLVYSLDQEPKDGPIVVLSNSLCAPYNAWDKVAEVLNENGFRTLRYNQPGHGGSSSHASLTTNFDSIAEDVHHLLGALGIAKVHAWVGVSMGATTGIYFVTNYPNIVSKLAICDTISASPVNMGVEDAFGPRVATARQAGKMDGILEGTLDRWFGKSWLESNPEETQRMRSIMLGTTLDGFETCCNALRSKEFDLRPRFTKVGAGVDEAICVVGENDANLPQTMAEMRSEVQQGFKDAGKEKNVKLVTIKNAGHVCFIDGYQQFIETIVPWIKA